MEEEYPIAKLWKFPARFRILSQRIATGLVKILKQELARKVALLIEQCLKEGTSVLGLVIARMINQWFYASSRGEAMYGLN